MACPAWVREFPGATCRTACDASGLLSFPVVDVTNEMALAGGGGDFGGIDFSKLGGGAIPGAEDDEDEEDDDDMPGLEGEEEQAEQAEEPKDAGKAEGKKPAE